MSAPSDGLSEVVIVTGAGSGIGRAIEQLDFVRQDKQRALFAALGIEDLLDTVSSTDSSHEESP